MFVPRQMDFAVLSVAELASAYVARKERVSRFTRISLEKTAAEGEIHSR